LLTWRFIALSIKSALEYRADFLFMVAVGAIWQTAVVVFATVIITRFPGLGGWSQGDVLLIAAIRMTGHALAAALFIGVRQISDQTAEGKIDAFLLRPLGVYRQVVLNYFHIPVLGDLIVAGVLFGAALTRLTIEWTAWRISYLVAALIGAMLLEAAVQTFLGTFGLRHPTARQWQEWVEELMSTFGNYPLHVLPSMARAVFVFILPIAFCAYLPAAILTGHTAHLPVPAWVAEASPAISALLYLASLAWWRSRLRRYESVGG
jgi:ABC-2 type transport system permease protein